MEKVRLIDRVSVTSRRTLKDTGQMIVPCTFARTGIQRYLARECGPAFAHLPPTQIVRMARLAEHVFHKDSLDSIFAAPVTIGHPDEDVCADNYEELVKGQLAGAPIRDGETLGGILVIPDQNAIRLIDGGLTQLSLGYDADLVPVKHPDYDCIQTNIRVNHIAIVRTARAGEGCRIADGETLMTEEEILAAATAEKTRLADEAAKATRMLDQATFDKMEAKIDTLTARLADAQQALAENKITPAMIAAAVSERLSFATSAAKLCDEDLSAMTMEGARRHIVTKQGKNVEGKSDDYVTGLYDGFLEDAISTAGPSDMSKALADQVNVVLKDAAPKMSPSEKSRLAMIARNEHTS